MKKYKVVKRIILGFITDRDQFDSWIYPEDNIILESDETTIYAIKEDGSRFESITMANAIDLFLKDGYIEEIQ